ncbi:acyltransferase [Horticoccus luteus]|uniref:Acyltransferase n=1 Tax=Horticoccus luteus TaxID=2862869 RepID=A0A8F9TYS1_9BACT|nr:acyltransferase [Horticoccus luteus]QYM80344.1 acyltransferase [Horticoccus luteus]
MVRSLDATDARRASPAVVRTVRPSLLRRLRARLYRHLRGTRVSCTGTAHQLIFHDALLDRCTITVSGRHNRVEIAPGARLWDARIRLTGENLVCRIGAHCRIRGVNLVVEDQGTALTIGDGTTMTQPVLVANEGRALHIGSDCMIAYGTDVRNSDGHSLLSTIDGERLNPAADVVIGDHVWLGINSQILKGVHIGDGAVVAARSLVLRDVAAHTLVGGTPARLLREHITWDRRRC